MLFLALAFASCHRGERQTLRSALQMAYADPDSALAMLHTIDRRSLPPAEKAYYALTYYLAQNKSGLDVANDSLIVSVSAMLVSMRQKNIAQVSILERYFFVSTYQAAGPDTCLAVFVVASLPPCL